MLLKRTQEVGGADFPSLRRSLATAL